MRIYAFLIKMITSGSFGAFDGRDDVQEAAKEAAEQPPCAR
jgi:hypothetical protein